MELEPRLPRTLWILLLLPRLMLPACTRFGSKRVPRDRFSYNEAIARSQKEQMLLNLVCVRYRDITEFLAVSSLLTQYNYTGTVLGLAPGLNVFKMTARLTQRAPDEITVLPRSLMGMISFLARGVKVPEAHREKGWVVDMGSWENMVPFRIHSSEERPPVAYAAVKYHDYCFYSDQTDHESKRVLNLLIYLFELQAPETSRAAPMLSLPTGP